MNISGFYFETDHWADNRELYQKVADNLRESRKRREEARFSLELYDLFPPGTEFKRLVAHRVQVLEIANPEWQRRGKLTFPRGKPEQLAELVNLDLGPELMREDGLDLYDWVQKTTNAIHYLGERRRIVGIEYEAVLREESALAKLDEFFEIRIEKDRRSYHLKMKREAFQRAVSNAERPREIHLESYLRLMNNDHDLTFGRAKSIARGGYWIEGTTTKVSQFSRKKGELLPTEGSSPGKFSHVEFFKS